MKKAQSMTIPEEKVRNWVFLTPIENLVLTKELGREITVDSVTFVDRDRLPYVRQRLGFKRPISEIKSQGPGRLFSDFFTISQTYAVARRRGKVSDIEIQCYRQVKDAVSILAVSQLGYARRRFSPHISVDGEYKAPRMRRLFVDPASGVLNYGGRVTGGIGDLALTGHWMNFEKHGFFFKLLDLLSGKVTVHKHWRQDLRRAAILIGQGLNSNDVSMSFLYNMIALERLLTSRGDKYTEALPERIEALLGWVGFWETDRYEERIREIYDKRSAFVHTGEDSSISKRDLLFTDDLLYNLLANLLNYSDLFDSKEAVLEFAEKVEAERVLGLKPTVRPKKLVFFARHYSERDLEEI